MVTRKAGRAAFVVDLPFTNHHLPITNYRVYHGGTQQEQQGVDA